MAFLGGEENNLKHKSIRKGNLVKKGNVCVYAYKVYTNAAEYTTREAKLEFTHEAVTTREDVLTPLAPAAAKAFICILEISPIELLAASVPKRYKETSPLSSRF